MTPQSQQPRVGNVSPVGNEGRKPWPPMVAGSTVYRLSVLTDAEKPWYWKCPKCELRLRGHDAHETAAIAASHTLYSHGGTQ